MADQHEHNDGDGAPSGASLPTTQASPKAPPAAPPPPGWGAASGSPGYGSGPYQPVGYGPPPGWDQTQPISGAPAPDQGGASTHPFGAPVQGQPGQDPPAGPFRAPGVAGHERRRPGWAGVVGVGAAAAVLSSLLTAGLVHYQDGGNTGAVLPAAAGSSPGTQSAPLVTSTAKQPDWVAVANAVEPSVVAVQVEFGNGGGEGSGVILDSSGRILTNNHVVAEGNGTPSITVVLSDGRAYPASIVGTDPSTDLAVIKINTSVPGLKQATLGDSSAVRTGDPVMAVGNPLGLSDTVTTGIVSALNRPVSAGNPGGGGRNFFGQPSGGEPVVTNAIQTDAAINPGNSGGALVDTGARVIGITSSIASLSQGGGQSGNIGLGFAIPINEAKLVADQIIKTGKVQHAYLGVSLQDNAVDLGGAQREAAIVRDVSGGSPAAQAGLKAGDAIIAINGQRIDSSNSLVGSIRAISPGSQVTLTIVRNGSQRNVSVTLATRANG
ncbi:MAG TPA: trypsin-like peptidase domain-containing protein [Kineosporiaceae bacterium]